MPAANGGGERGAEGGTEMVESGAARAGKEPDEVGVVRAGEEAGASLLKNTESAEGEKEGDDAAPSTNSTADVSVSVSPQEAEAAASLQLRQSLCYIGTFIAAGLMVGTCGPALPTLFKRINEGGNTPLATPTPPPWPPRRSGGGTGGEASLASAFALRAFGGLGGSILGGWLLMRVVPKGGHLILAGGLVVAAVCPVILCYATEASHVALAFILLDFGCGTPYADVCVQCNTYSSAYIQQSTSTYTPRTCAWAQCASTHSMPSPDTNQQHTRTHARTHTRTRVAHTCACSQVLRRLATP